MNIKGKRLIFFYDKREVESYLGKKNAPATTENVHIAMTPSARAELLRRGVEAESTLEYFTNDSHMRLLDNSKKLMERFSKDIEIGNLGIGVRQTAKNSFVFLIRCAAHYCMWVTEIVLNAVDKYKPESLAAAYSIGQKVESAHIEPEEMYLGRIVESIARERGMEFQSLSEKRVPDIVPWSARHLSAIARFAAKCLRFKIWKAAIIAKNKMTKKPFFLLTTTRGTNRIINDLNSRNPKDLYYFLSSAVIAPFGIPEFFIKVFHPRYSKGIINQKRLFEKAIEAIAGKKEYCIYRDVHFTDFVLSKLKRNILPFIMGEILWTAKIDALLEKVRPSAIISTGNRFDDIMLAELCLNKNIPYALVSHGSHAEPKNEYERIEWGEHGYFFLRGPFSHMAMQSPVTEGYFKAFFSVGNKVKTGPLAWGKRIKKKDKGLFEKMLGTKLDFQKTRVILHAGTPKRNGVRCYVYETPDEYVQSIRDMVFAVRKIPDTVLIVKFRPRYTIKTDDLKRLVSFDDKVVLSVEEPFFEVLAMADLLVSFSSTTIEEALQNRIPVLLYGGGGRYKHISACEIKSDTQIAPAAAYHVKKVDDLEYAIKGILDLDIKCSNKRDLFKPYVYAEHSRDSLVDSLNNRRLK